MGLSPNLDRFNAITVALVDRLLGIDKSMDDFPAHAKFLRRNSRQEAK